MHFTKMQGLGNDYIYFYDPGAGITEPEALARRLSDRHFGIGGDGIVLILPSRTADFRMRMFNADGSEGAMCGNACRCIGKYVYEKGLTEKTAITLETRSGIRTLHLHTADGVVQAVTVDMGSADFRAAAVPVLWEGDTVIHQPYETEGLRWEITCLSVGNPHCVCFFPRGEALPPAERGAVLERAPIFPERTNVELVQVLDGQTLEMRVWERGSGETLACGTGACAAAAAAVRLGFCPPDTPLTLRLRGGELHITVGQDGRLTMTGPAAFVFEGDLCL